MAYEVTASRRRPGQFDNLAGQEFVADTLKNSINSQQIAHAYLFSGPRGCGKTSTARILAKALNCQKSSSPTASPCGECDSCKAIANSSSLDVIEIDGASNTSVNDVRQIKDEVMFPPNTDRYKIYIIDEVHMLSNNAFNALLKTIEEPPEYVIFIFATTELQKVPATIKSRCQQYNFRLVSIEKLKFLLSEAAKESGIEAEDEALYWIARESGGSVRDSYTLFDQVAAFSQGHITYEKIRDKLGILGIERLNSIFESCAKGEAETALNLLDSFLQSGVSVEQFVSNCAGYLRSILLIKNGVSKDAVLGQSVQRFSKDVLNIWKLTQIERAFSLFLQLHRDLRYSISPRYELDLAISKMCWLKDYVSPMEVKAAIDSAQKLLQGGQPAVVKEVLAEKNREDKSLATNVNQDNSQSINKANSTMPAGMPIFSALKESSQNNIEKESTAPFYNGGTLPPENTENTEKKPVFGNLDVSANLETYVTESSYYENIEDSYYDSGEEIFQEQKSDNNNAEIDEQYYERIADETDKKTSVYNEDIHNSTQLFTAPDAFQITMGKLYAELISELMVNKANLAAPLIGTGQWVLHGNKIVTTIGNAYQKDMIENYKNEFLPILNRICHGQLDFEVLVKEEKTIEVKEEYPLQVRILCSVFKGSVIGKSEK